MVCYHEIISSNGNDTNYALLHEEDFDGSMKEAKDHVLVGSKIEEIYTHCNEDLLDILDSDYREIRK